MVAEHDLTVSHAETTDEHVSAANLDPGPPEAAGITLTGLVFETAAGLRRALAPGIECELGLGGLAFEVLIRLERSPGARLRMTDLAAQTGLTPGGLTRTIDRLVGAGLVCRQACPNDRRGAFAELTPLGQSRTNETLERHGRDIESIVTGVFDPGDTESLISLLRRLRDRVHPQAAQITNSAKAPSSTLPR
ncbi:MAG TPA: MarR family winged helix-turn-helix transcriptional regulator [Acidimicrobiales bacterium]|nr:MarR family winged helix-turn-helix transcriptional regulator [Acidimicrobiales bacterium]